MTTIQLDNLRATKLMRLLFLTPLIVISVSLDAQIMTLIATLSNGERDTVKFGFTQNASLGEDASLGEINIFQTPVNGYEGRILQRDSSNFSCAMELDYSQVYYEDNFDSKINYRDILDTSLQNRFFEIWYSDNNTDSMEMICDIPLRSFLYGAYMYPVDCNWVPPPPAGLLVIQNDTIKHIKYHLPLGLGIKQHIFITNPNITITAIDGITTVNDNKIRIYPNPTSGSLYFQCDNPIDIKEISVYDPIGQLIEKFDRLSFDSCIDISVYNNGAFIVIFELRNGEQVVKMILKQ